MNIKPILIFIFVSLILNSCQLKHKPETRISYKKEKPPLDSLIIKKFIDRKNYISNRARNHGHLVDTSSVSFRRIGDPYFQWYFNDKLGVYNIELIIAYNNIVNKYYFYERRIYTLPETTLRHIVTGSEDSYQDFIPKSRVNVEMYEEYYFGIPDTILINETKQSFSKANMIFKSKKIDRFDRIENWDKEYDLQHK